MPTECPQELYEQLCAFIRTAPIEIQTAFELNEKCYGIMIDTVLAEKRKNLKAKEAMVRAIGYINSGDYDVAISALTPKDE